MLYDKAKLKLRLYDLMCKKLQKLLITVNFISCL